MTFLRPFSVFRYEVYKLACCFWDRDYSLDATWTDGTTPDGKRTTTLDIHNQPSAQAKYPPVKGKVRGNLNKAFYTLTEIDANTTQVHLVVNVEPNVSHAVPMPASAPGLARTRCGLGSVPRLSKTLSTTTSSRTQSDHWLAPVAWTFAAPGLETGMHMQLPGEHLRERLPQAHARPPRQTVPVPVLAQTPRSPDQKVQP